jgi:acylphosphatase
MQQHASQESGPFGQGGNRVVAVEMAFFGSLGADFVRFAEIRARRLGLTGWIEETSGNRVLVHVEGPEALIGAFEMACCLGPDTTMVEDWESVETPRDTGLTGFSRRHGAKPGE